MDISLIHRERGKPWWQAISQIESIIDTSDEITGIPVICEYTLRAVDICNFFPPQSLDLAVNISSSSIADFDVIFLNYYRK
jgi:hypothetical protein